MQGSLVTASSRNFGVNEKALKIRMKSVGSIGKITKAMKMVSASKMKGDLKRLADGREFGCDAVDMIFKSDQHMQRKMGAEPNDPVTFLVPITSDKGLCGAVNTAIVRDVKRMVHGVNRSKYGIFSIGEKGSGAMIRPFPDMLKSSISYIQTPYNYPAVMAMAVNISQYSQDADKIIVIYNEFKSAIAYVIRHMELMPRKRFLESMNFAKLYNQTLPDKNTSNLALYELYLTSNIWVALLNNAASEQSARMNAMENASKNAKEIFDGLTLEYNKARQARITMELVEIISGASAL
jgi:F-type H+-transporting ATPase subunit gamma